MLRTVLVYPHPTLRMPSIPVDFERDKGHLLRMADDLVETMIRHQAAGISAIQVGLPLRVIVLATDEALEADTVDEQVVQSLDYEVICNPVFAPTVGGGDITAKEGCLSFPGSFINVKRWSRGVVTGFDVHNEPLEMPVVGYIARAAQHEIDHLDGKLLIDHASSLQKTLLEARAKKFAKRLAGADV